MKMTQGTFHNMRKIIESKDTHDLRERYRAGKILYFDRVKDINERYRWDLFYKAGGHRLLEGEPLNSDHIDTALRRIVPPL